MFELWDREATEEETEELIQKAAALIRKRKMETPAIFAIEMHKPLASVGAQATMFFAPFLVPFFGTEGVGAYSAIFSKRRNLERLLEILEQPPVEAERVSETEPVGKS